MSEVSVALNVVLDQVTSRLGAHAASVLLLNAHTRTLRHAGSRGFHTAPPRRAGVRLGEGLAGRAVLERSVLYVPDIAHGQVLADGLGLVGPGQVLADHGEPEHAALASDAAVASEKFVSYRAVPLIAAGQVKGVLEVWHRAPLPLDEEAEEFLETLAGQAAIDNASLFRDLQRSNDDLVLAYDSTLEGWSGALDLRDKETEGHSQRVTSETVRLARHMGLPDKEIVLIRRGVLLHDIGKMGIPDAILLKPGPLSDEEWIVMKKHPTYAYELLSPIAFLRPALDIAYAHHEKWDGSGYPRGLAGEQIPLSARLFAVVDVWDALCSDRPYRKGWPIERVLDHIRDSGGSHFDPQVVHAFLEMHLPTRTASALPAQPLSQPSQLPEVPVRELTAGASS